MEGLYSKLYDKFNAMKTKKITEMEAINKDQEEKFANYVSVAEELIQHLKNENGKLLSQFNDLRAELASVRASKECSEYQTLWIEENQKNKALSEEIERLQEHKSVSNQKGKTKRQENTPQTILSKLSDSSPKVLRSSKRRKLSITEADRITQQDSEFKAAQEESPKGLQMQTLSTDTVVRVRQPECCRTIGKSGDNEYSNCMFQALVEYLVGMKFSVITQNGACLSAEHPSSGYSFSLTWLDGKEVEMLYHVISLGTFERVAPRWMKEAIMFSTTMCPIFFERVSRVVKLYS